MELHEENLIALKGIWSDEKERQNAKIVLFQAIANATELTAKETDDIFYELDQLLKDEKEEKATRLDPAT